MIVTKKAIIKLQSAFRRRIARRQYLIIRHIRRNKAATVIQSCVRRRQAVTGSERRRALIYHMIKSSDCVLSSSEWIHVDPVFQLLRDITLLGDFPKAYKASDLLVSHYQGLRGRRDCPPQALQLAFWSASIGTFLSSVTYWSKYGPTRQLNFFILERALGVVMQYAASNASCFPQSSNPFLSDDYQLSLAFRDTFQSPHRMFDVLDVFFQQCNLPNASRLKQFDALVLKADMLMLFLWWAPPPRTFSVAPDSLPVMRSAGSTDIHSHRIVKRIWQLLLKAKSLLSPGSSDQYELKFRLEFYSSLCQAQEQIREASQPLPVTFVSRNAAPNFRPNHSNLPPSGMSANVRLQVHRIGFLIIVTGRIQEDVSHSHEAGTYRHRNTKIAAAAPTTAPDLAADPRRVFFSLPSMAEERRAQLLEQASDGLRQARFIRPLILFANEVEYLAEMHELYLIKSSRRFSSLGSSSALGDKPQTVTVSVSTTGKKPVLDYRKVAAFLVENVSLVLLLPSSGSSPSEQARPSTRREKDDSQSSPLHMIESPWQLSLADIDKRRMEFLESNDARYSALLIQRIYRGHAGRLRFAIIRRNFLIYRRKKWLAWKVLYRWKVLRQKLDFNASLIQSRVKGWCWRRKLALMKAKVVAIQCMFRCYHARARVRRERDRRRGGPAVIEMLHGGRTVGCGDRKFFLKLFRCGNNYRFQGVDMLRGATYNGSIHASALQDLIEEYNARHSQKLRIWQYEAVAEYIANNLALINRIPAGTTALGAAVKDTDLTLIVSNTLQGVFSDSPPESVLPVIPRPGVQKPAVVVVNNYNLPVVGKLLPPLRGPDHTPVHVKIMREKRRKEKEERRLYYSYSSRK